MKTLRFASSLLLAYLAAAASNHGFPLSVAQVISGILSGSITGFRIPVGLDRAPLLAWRASMGDEDWVAVGGIDKESWVAGMAQMDMDVKSHFPTRSGPGATGGGHGPDGHGRKAAFGGVDARGTSLIRREIR